jgi:hypothetical protein
MKLCSVWMVEWMVNSKLERVWKKFDPDVMWSNRPLSRNLLGGGWEESGRIVPQRDRNSKKKKDKSWRVIFEEQIIFESGNFYNSKFSYKGEFLACNFSENVFLEWSVIGKAKFLKCVGSFERKFYKEYFFFEG